MVPLGMIKAVEMAVKAQRSRSLTFMVIVVGLDVCESEMV